MRLGLALLSSLVPIVAGSACVSQDDTIDLGSIADGKNDAPALRDVEITVPKRNTNGNPGVRNYAVHSTVDFTVAVAFDTAHAVKVTVTNLDTLETFQSEVGANPRVNVRASADAGNSEFKIRVENHTESTLRAKLSALGAESATVSPALLAAARANLDRVTRELDATHLQNYGLSGSLTDQFMAALSAEYETQHPDQYAARISALASMIFFALPDVLPPAEGKTTPFHGLDSGQFDDLANIEDAIFEALTDLNNNDTNGVRPFSVCETKFIIESYVRPRVAYPGFDAHKAAYTAFAESCPAADKAEWYNFRGLGHLRPSWVESNLADRFLRRQAKNCRNPSEAQRAECDVWSSDRFGYRQLRNRQLSARTMFYAPGDEGYLVDPDNALVFLEDRTGDGIGEFLRPGPVTLATGATGTLQVNSTGEFTGNLKFVPSAGGAAQTVTPAKLVAESSVMPGWRGELLGQKDMGLLTLFADSTGCTGDRIDPAACPLMQRFYSMIDRHENFYRTYSALSPDYYGVSSQPSPLVACSITLMAAHHWDSAGIPSGGTAGFIFLMRIPFADILTGNETSVATVMPGPKTTSIQSLYAGTSTLDMSKLWLDIASLSNNLYANEHEISAFGAVTASQIEGILVVRKPAAVQ